MTSPSFRQLRLAVYSLKRKYGQAITLCRTTGNSTNYETGRKVENLVKHAVKRAVILPNRVQRGFSYDLTLIAANKNFTYGGFYDHRKRAIIVDRRDVPSDWPWDLNMHVVFNGKRLEVKEFQEFEEAECVLLLTEQLDGSPLMDQHDESLNNNVGLDGTVEEQP